MKSYYEFGSSGSGRGAKRMSLPGPPDDCDDVLLPANSSIPVAPSVFPPRQLKWRDYLIPSAALSFQADASGGVINPTGTDRILGVDQGPNQYQRNGNVIFVESIQVRGMLYHEGDPVSLSVNLDHWAMLSLCLDCQTNNSQCTSQQIFSNFSGSSRANVVPLRNMDLSNRFAVLKTELFDLSPKTLTLDATSVPPEFSWGGRGHPVDFFVHLKRVVNFNASGAGILSMLDLSAHLVGFCNNSSVSTYFIGHARIRFCDLS